MWLNKFQKHGMFCDMAAGVAKNEWVCVNEIEGLILRKNLLPTDIMGFFFSSIRLGGETVEDYVIFTDHYIWNSTNV